MEPLHVSMPRELKSRPSTSPTHPGGVMTLEVSCLNTPSAVVVDLSANSFTMLLQNEIANREFCSPRQQQRKR